MSFVQELKQRKVFRVAAAYLVVAWLLVQVADVALPAFGAPDWALRIVILVAALGFPLALLLAWALELQPDGIAFARGGIGNKRIATIAALLVAVAFAWFFWGQPAVRQQLLAADRSIAVLPFVNMSGDKANEYFSDGIAETTLDMLAQVPDLKVIARTSSFAFKGKHADMRDIGKALDAAHLLEGSVQQAGDTVRITAQLIRVSDGSHLWSKRFDRKLADVFAIQDEIATEVVKAIQGALPAAQQARLVRRRTDNVAAYDEYLKGLNLLPGRKVPEMRRALAHFERAIELDPSYARAHAMAGTTASLLRTYGDDSAGTERKIARYIDRALELAPDLGEAWAARGAQLQMVYDFAGAEAALRKAVQLAPGYATGYQWLGEFYQDFQGDLDKGLPLLQRATVLDPLSPIIQKEYAVGLAAVERLDEAKRVLQRVLRDHPDFAVGHEKMALVHAQDGNLVEALREIDTAVRLDPEIPYFGITRCHVLVQFGAMDDAARCFDALARRAGNNANRVRLLEHKAFGRHAEALALVEAMPDHDPYDRAVALFHLGRYEEAATLLRPLLMPNGQEAGEFRTPPVAESKFVEDQLFVGVIRHAKGETAAARVLWEYAAQRAAAQPAGAGQNARRWNDVFALALLGRHAQACAAYRASLQAGLFTDYDFAARIPVLAEFRDQPCYRDVVAVARQRAEAEIAKARAAGLLQG